MTRQSAGSAVALEEVHMPTVALQKAVLDDRPTRPSSSLDGVRAPSRWRRYLDLTKPKVVALISFTALVGALLARPESHRLDLLAWGVFGIALAAASAAALNHVLDRHIDAKM